MKYLHDGVVEHLRDALASGEDPGATLDLDGTKYRYIDTVGAGGMGQVHVVEDTQLTRRVALKVVEGPHAEALGKRLRREAKVLARLEHPGIVPVHDFGKLRDGRPFYVMKLVRGDRLDVWLRQKEPSLQATLRFVQRICEAVAFAHAHDVIHRDLKPENIMVGAFGEALVMDWGLAKDLRTARPPRAEGRGGSQGDLEVDPEAATLEPPDTDTGRDGETAHGSVLGTPAYMSPEQARGDIAAVDHRSDIYALGAILYFVLAGRAPFTGGSARDVVHRVLHDEPAALDAGVPRALTSICAHAMARNPDARYQSAMELAEDIGRFTDSLPVSVHRESLVERTVRFVSRHRVLLTLLGAYLIVRLALALFVPG